MPVLVMNSSPSHETGIAGEIEAGWSILEDGAVNAVDESCMVEVINSARGPRNDIGNSLRKVGIPPDTEVYGHAGFDLPGIGRIGIDVDLVSLMLVRLALEERR